MPELSQGLMDNDLGFLRMVAHAWGLELPLPDASTALPALVNKLHNQALFQEVYEALPQEAKDALGALMDADGCMPWAAFCRRFGEVRLMGVAWRDRERPDLNPVSVSEILWYRALICKAFLKLSPEPQEYAFIPDDLQQYLKPMAPAKAAPLGRPALPSETTAVVPVSDRILDHLCTWLAARRSGVPLLSTALWKIPLQVIEKLLECAGMIDSEGKLQTEAVRIFLESPRSEALAQLSRAWLESDVFNELFLLPGLVCEGNWNNYPRLTRQEILSMLSQLPGDSWWNIDAFIAAIKEKQPDFQRPGGDYDSWFIRKEGESEYLRGFDHWDDIDGSLVRFMITGPLHWLGWYELASPSVNAPVTAFRPSHWASALRQGHPPEGMAAEKAQVRVTSDGRIRVPFLTPRSVRYQLARFCEWGEEKGEEYSYQVTSISLERARQQGLRTSHLITLLRRHAAQPLPPVLLQALDRWEKYGPQARLEQTTLLRLTSPEILTALRKTSAARYLGEVLSPTVVTLKPDSEEKIRQALAELGYLAEEIV